MFHVEHESELKNWLQEGSSRIGVTLQQSHIDYFLQYLSELRRWNKKTNLTSIKNGKEIIAKHFLDSIAFEKAIGRIGKSKVIDAGSGAGFPGIPIKILNQDSKMYLLEPSQKKTAFLRHVVGTLQLNGCVTINENIEMFSDNLGNINEFDFIVTRALSVEEFFRFFKKLLKNNGKIILFRAKSMENDEIGEGLRLINEVPYEIPFGFGDRVLTIIQKLA